MNTEIEVLDLLAEALQLPVDRRKAFLSSECRRTEVRRKIESILEWRQAASRFQDKLPQVGSEVGKYRVRENLGEGGTGLVYRVERLIDGTPWVAALKVLRPCFLTSAVFERSRQSRRMMKVFAAMDSISADDRSAFESNLSSAVRGALKERFPDPLALARLKHPNIAALHDFGSTDEGLPYVVMEYVDGQSIDAYSDGPGVDVSDCLGTFIKVCKAVGHAHRQRIIHCDLKPSNILVTQDGEVKLLDFSIAQVLGNDFEPVHRGPLGMTPEYASPEQARGEVLGIATDIYSLGVLLYRLLSGRLPYSFREDSLEEYRRVICTSEVLPASAAVTSDIEAKAERRQSGNPASGSRKALKRRRRQLRGDLDAIILKAMSRDPENRYDSADLLSKDIEEYLARRPVSAQEANLGYLVGRFLQRRWVEAAVSCVLLLLAVGTAWKLTLQWNQIRQQQDLAVARLAQSSNLADFIDGIFKSTDPYAASATNEAVTATDILRRGAERIESALDDQPLVKAMMLTAIGRGYRQLGSMHEARRFIEAGFEIRKAHLPPDDLEMADSHHNLGMLWRDLGKHADAQSHFSTALELQKRHLGDEHLQVSGTLFDLAMNFRFARRLDKAEQALLQALEIRRLHLDSNDFRVSATLAELGNVYRRQGRFKQAEETLLAALENQAGILPENHTNIANSHNSLALVYSRLANYDSASRHYGIALKMWEEILGANHPHVATMLFNIGTFHLTNDDFERSEEFLMRALSVRESATGRAHPEFAATLHALAGVYLRRGEHDRAIPLFEESLLILQDVWKEEHPSIARTLNSFGALYFDMGDLPRAEAAFSRSVQMWLRLLPKSHEAAQARANLAAVYRETGRFSQAEALAHKALEAQEKLFGKDHPALVESLIRKAESLQDRGFGDRAEPLLRRALGICRSRFGEEHYATAMTQLRTARALDSLGDRRAAREHFQRAIATLKRVRGEDHAKTSHARVQLAWHHLRHSEVQEAKPLLEQSLTSAAGILSRNERNQRVRLLEASALLCLGLVDRNEGRSDSAERRFQEAVTSLRGIAADSGAVRAMDLLARGRLLLGDREGAAQILRRLERMGWKDERWSQAYKTAKSSAQTQE